MHHIKYYIKIRNWKMAVHLIMLYLKLWWPVKCACPDSLENPHNVEVMYWPRTAYHWDGKGIDPNGPMLLCKEMAKECQQYWDDMWSEYYSQVL